MDVVHVRISAEQRRELGINDPSNLSARMRLAKQSYRWERVDDVAERTRLDNQDRFRIQSFRLKGSEFGGPACVKATARQNQLPLVSDLIAQSPAARRATAAGPP